MKVKRKQWSVIRRKNDLVDDVVISDVDLFRLEWMDNNFWWHRGRKPLTFDIVKTTKDIVFRVREDMFNCRDDTPRKRSKSGRSLQSKDGEGTVITSKQRKEE